MYKDTCQDKSHKTGPIFMAWNACDDERKRAADTSSIGPILQGTDIRDNNVRVKDEIKTKYDKATILNYLIIIIPFPFLCVNFSSRMLIHNHILPFIFRIFPL